MNKEKIKITTFEEHLTKRHGALGTKSRTQFEIKAKAFAIGEMIKEERRLAKMTQNELAQKIGARKGYISLIENGHTDIQLSTLYKLFEVGLNKKVNLTIN